ncbi:MAG: ATP-binding protein [Chlamydiia bacterium]|nr:ATP-binding protein [Chlamydiia bacterium]
MRRFLLKKLFEWKGKKGRKPMILKGARQVGKTTLLKTFGEEAFEKVHYLNFEEDHTLCDLFKTQLDPKHLINEIRFKFESPIDIHTDLVIFDEIQACPKALTSLKYFCEEMPELAVCAAGSLLGVYLTPVSFPVGKVDIMHLNPLTFEEFLLALEEKQLLEEIQNVDPSRAIPTLAHEALFRLLKHYFVVGGLPEVVKIFRDHRENLYEAMLQVRETQDVLVETYLADIAKHAGKVNAMHVARVFKSVPEQLAATHDGNASKFQFKGIVPGIDRYQRLANAIDWLLGAGLILKVPIVATGYLPFSSHAHESQFKLYLFDVGLLGAMCPIKPKTLIEYTFGSYKGFFAENYVAQALLTTGIKQLFCWREKLAEVEFLYDDEGVAIPLEVKSGHVTHAKSAKIFADKYHSSHRVIFSGRSLNISPTLHRYPLYLVDQFPLKKESSNEFDYQ